MPIRIDSNFSIGSLYAEKIEPTLFLCSDFPEPLYEINFKGSVFSVKVNGRNVNIDVTSENLRKIRHEMICSVLTFESDRALSTIGVLGEEGDLSPDFISYEDKAVIEVGSSFISEMFALRNSFNGKMVKYSYLLEPLNYELYVIIVSPSRIYTNMKLSQDIVNALCYRMRIGLALESVIKDVLGSDIFSDDLTADEAIVKDVFRGLKIECPYKKDFDIDEIKSIAEKPSNEDFKHTGEVLRDSLERSTQPSRETKLELKNYLSKFDTTSKTSNKRVTNIPMVLPFEQFKEDEIPAELDPESAENMPKYLKKIWFSAKEVKIVKIDIDEQIEEAMGEREFIRHRVQKNSAFNVSDLNDDDKVEAAKTGLWAKKLKTNGEIMDKELEDRKSFHPTLTDTSDIKKFINTPLMRTRKQSAIPKPILKLMRVGKSVWSKKTPLSLTILEKVTSTDIIWFSQMVSDIMTEVCYTYKYWIKRSDFYLKTCKDIKLLVRCTGDHVFVAYAFPSSRFKIIDTGRIGPGLFVSNNYIFTDFCSYNEPTIEHFVKCGPYMSAIICHMLSHLEMSLEFIDLVDKVLNQHVNTILLLYLCNKTDCEELITSQRYLTMGLFEELDPNPYRFCERLPEVVRSRLTCFFIKKTIEHIEYYAENVILKIPNKENFEYDVKYTGLLSLFGDYEPTLKQKINEFYFGYVVSKERGRGSDRNFKIMKKIVQEEYRYRDTVINTFEASLDPKIHVSNPIVIRVFIHIFKTILRSYLGQDYEKVIKNEIVKAMAMTSFEDLATLKVAARTYNSSIVVPTVNEEMSTAAIRKLYESANPGEKVRRPRVMEALAQLVQECETATSRVIRHPVELLPYCLEDINKRGYWDSDIFPKAQHGGDREIHVLEIKMRIIQFFTESMSKTLCRLCPSDTLTHPYEKESFVNKHYSHSQLSLGDQFFTLGKSADATKWCQRNDSSKFAAVVSPLLPEEFRDFFIYVMFLWKEKRISFPIQFAANFQSNRNTKSNPIYSRMKKEFFNGSGIFEQQQSNKMMIRSGMMQGILHYTSSITHAVIQEVMKKIQVDYLKRRKVDSYITVVQGSDDSAELLSIKGEPSKTKLRLATTMLHWKENVSKQFSIYTSRAKSAIGTLDLVEYNSEWMIRSNVIKPTFRWVSACLETTVTERFIDRIRINYNVSSQVLEGGGKVLEVACLQLCQSWLHYLLLGLHTSSLSNLVSTQLSECYDPSLGFYPLDSDYCAGITGVEFQMFKLFKSTVYGVGLSYSGVHDPGVFINDDEIPDMSIGKSLRSVRVKFSDMKLWRDQMRRMDVPELSQILEKVEENPFLIYVRHRTWEESKYSIYLKMFQPGVKESLSRHAATARVMAASAYMISRPCINLYTNNGPVSLSLLQALFFTKFSSEDKTKLKVEDVFTHSAEYGEVLDYIDELEERSTLVVARFRTKTKQRIAVFEKSIDDVPLIDLCKKKWFNLGKLPLSRRQFETFWQEAKVRYPFIKDSRQETKELLNMNELELKNFLESMTTKPRKIVLLDTSAKSSSLFSSITRIFWNGVKIVIPGRSDEEESSYSLRSKIFSVLTSWLDDSLKKQKLKTLIKDSTLLSKKIVPSRVKMIRVIHRWLNGVDKGAIVRYIAEERLGSVGFFTVRQKGWGKTRSGYGEWRGKCLDTSVVIRMNGNHCTEIELDRLTNLRTLGPLLLELITNFSLTPVDKVEKSDHWLTPSGKLLGGSGKHNFIPVYVNGNLKVDIIDQLSDYEWNWDILDNRVRLIAEVSEGQKITIISDNFTCRDWDPEFKIDDDLLLKYWSSGKPIPLETIEGELKSVVKPLPGSIMRAIRQKHTIKTANNWNLGKFIDVVNTMLVREILPLPELEESSSDYLDYDIDALIYEMNVESVNDDSWFKEDIFQEEEDFSMDLFECDNVFDENLDSRLQLFSQNFPVDPFIASDKKTMSSSNLALDNLNLLARIVLDVKTFRDAVKRFKANVHLTTGGLLGLLLSFFCSRCCLDIPGDMDEEMSNLNIESLELADRLVKNEITETPEEIEDMIKNLETTIEVSPRNVQKKLRTILNRYKAAKQYLKETKMNDGDLESYSVRSIVNIIKLKLKQDEIEPSDPVFLVKNHTKLPTDIYIDLLRSEMDAVIDKRLSEGLLTQYEHSTYRESVRKPYISSLFLDVVSWIFDLKIKLQGYETGGNVELDLNELVYLSNNEDS
ncbi:putative RNA-dependent RNA polymerase [Watermelon crinkle leaf-associated virus 2]|uniref:RNA-directed RNA polymerase L n=2 Tax=Watermelon crinkle leaf-associated virus 2 TaxID=2034157 RepID=A0A286S2U2_9VIRU|nr:putative RNA-dependent RNA polymerase [Watermelon crinkle leaf-associated virus 2]ASY01343.1 RdRp [Watermelon crinkle leaf-associated virus 2]QVE55498.1 putative RNA-dependent RNA polymerase [Watermelon crinkle leaf-associated virus 2]